ncbi:MAG: quinolinate synthase NadA [Clostridia bacterium]|nr:quinolinate synthase NadA [Clostridia bacterium]
MVNELESEILRLKQEKGAMIFAHHYQIDEVKAIADHVGDSLEMARIAADSEADILVICGVSFMAETAKILSPSKTVLLPNLGAGCPMADMVTADDVRKAKEADPGLKVVCYVNSSAEVKAESDICCTSSNALKVVSNLEAERILFVPDQNLGGYVSKQCPEREIAVWRGFCPTHHRVESLDVARTMAKYPNAYLMVHPECRPEVLDYADFVGSTSQIINRCRTIEAQTIVIGTEVGVISTIRRENPGKEIVLLDDVMVCPNMKKTTLEDVYRVLRDGTNAIEVDENIREKAFGAIDAMLKVR